MSLPDIVRAIGYVGIAGIVFAESGLLIGFMLPGDSLLITAGLLASQGYFSYPLLAMAVYLWQASGPAHFLAEELAVFQSRALKDCC
jgi:membrane-associated protein